MGEEEPYFLELVRYLHLNPVRAGIVSDLDALARYPWSGHAALLGRSTVGRQETRTVLDRFSAGLGPARAAYRAFVAAGLGQGRRLEFQGGGLVRSAGGWLAVAALRRGREGWRRVVAHARAVASWLLVLALGLPIVRAAQLLNISPTVIREGVPRAEVLARPRGLHLRDLVGVRKI